MKLEVVYVRPNRLYAHLCDLEKTGCYVVMRGFNRRTGALLRSPVLETPRAFATEADAQAWIEKHAVAADGGAE